MSDPLSSSSEVDTTTVCGTVCVCGGGGGGGGGVYLCIQVLHVHARSADHHMRSHDYTPDSFIEIF